MQRALSQMTILPVMDEMIGADGDVEAPRSYLELYGFAHAPFATQAPQGAFVLGESHRLALEALVGAMIAGKSAVVLTGEGQTGKSSLLQTAVTMVEERGLPVLGISNKEPGALTLKRLLSKVIGLPEPVELSKADSDRAHAVLLTASPGASHRVVAIDDAETLSAGALRYLTQLCKHPAHCPQFVFVGAPPVWPMLRQGEYRPLTQRVGVRLRITRLTGDEAREYIERRLWMAGSETRKVLSAGALADVVVRTEGIPGRINAALDRVFAAGFEHGHARVTPQTVRIALGVPRPTTLRASTPRRGPPIWLIAGASLAIGIAATLYANRDSLPDPSSALAWVTAQRQ
jgi:general secretion pathway protein A